MPRTTYGDISQRTAAHAVAKMLSHAEPVLVLSRFGQSKPLPRNTAKTQKFRRAVPFTVSTTPVTEGITPPSKRMQYEDVSATIAQYIGVVAITDHVADLNEDPVLTDATKLCGEEAAETLELVTWGVLKAGTTVFYGDSADTSRSDVNDRVSIGRIRAVVRYLKNQRARMITEMLKSSVNFGTQAVAPAFIGFCHTDMESDIQDLPGFVAVENYGAAMKALPNEIGKVESVRFITSPVLDNFESAGSTTLNGMVSTDATNVDVYPLVIVGQESYGLVPLKGKESITITVLNPDKPSKSDPAGQRGFVTWKAWYTAVRLNETWMARVEVGVTDLGSPQ